MPILIAGPAQPVIGHVSTRSISTRKHLTNKTIHTKKLLEHQTFCVNCLDNYRVAQQLFATLRELDQPDIKLIWVETPPEEAVWDGVRDRLTRAAA